MGRMPVEEKLKRYSPLGDQQQPNVFAPPVYAEYDRMPLEMLREVIPMLRQQLEKAQMDRNYVQLERVSLYIWYLLMVSATLS